MIGYRCWGVRQVPTGKTVTRPVLADTWQLAMPPGAPWGLPLFEVEHVPVFSPRLVGMGGSSQEQTWEPGWSQAHCIYSPHPAPSLHPSGDQSGCGFHALVDLHRVAPTAVTIRDNSRGRGCMCMVVGLAALAGDVIEGRDHRNVPVGWRGAEARVLGLLTAPQWTAPVGWWEPPRVAGCYCEACDGISDAAEEWAVSCHPHGHISELADVYGVPVFSHPRDLERYAGRCRAGLPRTWQTVPIANASPSNDGGPIYQNIQQTAVNALAAAQRQLPRFPPLPQPQGVWHTGAPAPDPEPKQRATPGRRLPWWGRGAPPQGSGPARSR
jgi:hypothetical protein